MTEVLVTMSEDDHECIRSKLSGRAPDDDLKRQIAKQHTIEKFGHEYSYITWDFTRLTWVFEFDDPNEAVLFKLRHA